MDARDALVLRTFFTALCDFLRCPRTQGDTTTLGRRARAALRLGTSWPHPRVAAPLRLWTSWHTRRRPVAHAAATR